MTKPTLGRLAHDYVNERLMLRTFAKATAAGTRYNLLSFARLVGYDELPRAMTEAHIVEWLSDPRIGVAGKRTRLSQLRSWVRWLMRRGHLSKDPTRFIERAKQPRLLPRGLALDSVEAVFEVAPDERARLILCLMVQEGLRCIEVATVEFGDLNFGERLLLVTGKGGHQRVLPISDQTWEALGDYLRHRGRSAGTLIRSKVHPARGVSPAYVSFLVRTWFRQAGVAATGHQLRHTAATDMLRAGAHVRDVQRALGHTSLATTEMYLPWLVGDLRTAMGGRWYGPDAA